MMKHYNYELMFFGAVFVNSWDPFLSLCLVGSTWVFFLFI